jgi:segregation and condensation protein B
VTPLAKLLEAALFASNRPLALDDLRTLDPDATPAAVASALDELREHYDVDGHGIELTEQGGGWQLLTRPEYTEAIERAQVASRPSRLSAAALETLAIVAYRQPIGRAEIEEIRGVSVGSLLKSLHERGLVDVVARGEGLGRPLLYGTTPQFLEQFALRHLEELPRADELAIALRAAGSGGAGEVPDGEIAVAVPLEAGLADVAAPAESDPSSLGDLQAAALAPDAAPVP